jgi:hypothetical protein
MLQRQARFFGLTMVLACACGRHIELGRDYPPMQAAGGTSSTTDSAAPAPCVVTPCSGKIYACGDCVDNDSDGAIDSADTECLGPCDDTEDSYFSAIAGENNAPCKQDCMFDQDSGSGNDDCHWSQKCDPLSVAPGYPPSGDSQCAYDAAASIPGTSATCVDLASQQSATCLDTCMPLTPNGCDCFGCCELPAGGGNYVWIGSTSGGVGSCDELHLADPLSCRPCTPTASCLNDCNPCEICAGRLQPAADCVPATDPRCPADVVSCGLAGEAPCGASEYCISGCCATAPT